MTYEEMAQLNRQYTSLRFRRKYTCSGSDLGVFCSDSGTDFALWAPLARSLELILYEDGEGDAVRRRIAMKKGRQGVWRHREPGNLHGCFYAYRIDNGEGPILTGDPWARSCSANSRRCMAVDLKKTDPEGWDRDTPPEKAPEDIIWETHVKEFSWDPAGGFPEPYRGKYLAFTCPHTNLDGKWETGLAYLRRLGVTTLELMPIFDYGSVDENDPKAFNWGYDPVYYNIPEGSYATDPSDGVSRIRECKQMIAALHAQGFRVVMDVVFNHTYSLDSPFNRTVPGYFYRHDRQGHACNGSLCGNELATERPMCGNFIVNSLLYWAEEYHIDGFRFDLMGLMDCRLMNRIRWTLDQRFGKGEKTMWGEPWAGAAPALPRNQFPADKANMALLDPDIAMFCDNTRDAIKGHIFYSGQPGFAGGAENLEQAILGGLAGWQGRIPGITRGSQLISYVSCHDNLTLYDKLSASSPPDRDMLSMYRLCAAILMACRGRIFLLSGEEFGRTKGGCDNTYNAPIEVNRLDWQLAWDRRALTDYYRGLIAIRKSSPGLRSKGPENRILSQKVWRLGLQVYVDDGEMGTLCLIYNSSLTPKQCSLEPGRWKILADGENSFLWKEDRWVSGTAAAAPVSALILRKDP